MRTPINRRDFLSTGIMAGFAPGLRGCFQSSDAPSPTNGEETNVPGSQVTVAQYVVQRLAALGIKHVFGVPGDYSFPLDIAIENNTSLTWVGCSNELNAAYAADGYARINGAAILCTTYDVGSAAALAGVMGCKAERVPVFHLSGAPSTQLQLLKLRMHHSYGDGNLSQFYHYHDVSVCASVTLTPETAVSELEDVIKKAASQRMPVYIEISEDSARTPIVETPPFPTTPFSQMPIFSGDPDKSALDAALKAIQDRIKEANYTVILASFTIARYGLIEQLKALLKTTKIPVATTGMSKGLMSESDKQWDKQWIGMYNGTFSPDISAFLDKADLVLDLGGVIFCDGETGEFSKLIDPAKVITVFPDKVEIGCSAGNCGPNPISYSSISIKDILEGLTQNSPHGKQILLPKKLPAEGANLGLEWEKLERLLERQIFGQLLGLLQTGDILMTDTGVGDLIATFLALPDGVEFQHALLWGSIGWGTGAALGAALADPSRRVILIQGDGGHQCTVNQIGTMGKYEVNPIIIVLNNDIYGVEEVVMGNANPRQSREFDRIAQWDYCKIPDAMGCSNWRTHLVDFTDLWHLDKAFQSLEEAMDDARDHRDTGAYIVVKLNRDLLFPGLPKRIRDRLYMAEPPKA
jgi:indolepyruvate decarboxylase